MSTNAKSLKSTQILDGYQQSLDLLEKYDIVAFPDGLFDLGDIYLPMGNSDLWGDWDCRNWLKEGIDWWRKEIISYVKDRPVKAEGLDHDFRTGRAFCGTDR